MSGHRLSSGIIAVGLVAAALVLRLDPEGSATVKAPRVIEAERFVVRDAEGRIRGSLGLDEEDEAIWRVFYPDGALAASLTMETDRRRVHFELMGPEGTGHLALNVARDIAGIGLRSGDGQKFVELAACDNHACWHVHDREEDGGNASLHVNAGAGAYFGLGAGSHSSVGVSTERQASPRVEVRGEDSSLTIEQEEKDVDSGPARPLRIRVEKSGTPIGEFPARRGPV